MICTAHQLPESHGLRFVLEAVKMLYTLLKTARNSGESYLAMHAWVDSKRIDPIAELPLPASLFAITHVAATAAMAVVMNKLRSRAVTLVNSAGRVQFEQFLCPLCSGLITRG
jgi:hypothetical protein